AVCGPVAATLAQAMTKNNRHALPFARGLSVVLTGADLHAPPQRAAGVAASLVARPQHPLSGLPLLTPLIAPPSSRLSDHQLIELLRQPLFVGEARRMLLDLLGERHGRRFSDQWDFVEFAEGRRLDLDFTTPPIRPDTTPPTANASPRPAGTGW